jgi:polyisoprenoid-binding protein YceI
MPRHRPTRCLSVFALLCVLGVNSVDAVVIDAEKSKADIKIHPRLPIASQGRFTDVNGQLLINHDQSYSVEVVLDGRKLLFSGPAWLNRMARSKEFLDVDTYPNIRFTSNPFRKDILTKGGELAGELSLRGQQRPVTFSILPASCSEPGHDCALKVRGEVNRREFGMHTYRFSVKDNVDFEFNIFFQSKPL